MSILQRREATIAVMQLFPGVALTLWQAGDGWRFGGWKVTPTLFAQQSGAVRYPLRDFAVVQPQRRFKTAEQAVDFYRDVLRRSHRSDAERHAAHPHLESDAPGDADTDVR